MNRTKPTELLGEASMKEADQVADTIHSALRDAIESREFAALVHDHLDDSMLSALDADAGVIAADVGQVLSSGRGPHAALLNKALWAIANKAALA